MNERNEKRERRVKKRKPKVWKVMYANARGLNGKKQCIVDILDEVKPEIMLFAETQLKSNVGVKFTGYTFFGKSRDEKSGGGVGILVQNELKGMVAPHYSNKELEILWVSVRRYKKKPLYIGVY